jgi:DNA helicase HerA-like ATPase
MTALLEFLNPATGSGPSVLRAYQQYHAADAGNFQTEILQLLDEGKTVILDLGNATDSIRRYFSNLLSTAVFRAQETKFVSNDLGNRYVQLYFEEAHNLFPPESKDLTGVYARFSRLQLSTKNCWRRPRTSS